MSRFFAFNLPLAGLKRIERQVLPDERGFLCRLFCAQELAIHGWEGQLQQVNHTYTRREGVIRGLHYQRSPHCEIKLVSALRGAVWDLAVDLRRESATFLHWHAEILSAENGRAMLIPKGFAHGFQTLSDDVELLYCHSAPYESGAEAGLYPLDATLGIDWPLPVSEMSARDRAHPRLDDGFTGVEFQ